MTQDEFNKLLYGICANIQERYYVTYEDAATCVLLAVTAAKLSHLAPKNM